MKYSFTFLSSILSLLLLSACASFSRGKIVAIKCGHLFDSEHAEWRKDQTLLIQDGKIQAVNPIDLPTEVETIDYSAFWVIPGLIDAHSHVFLEDATYSRDFTRGLLDFMKTHTDDERKAIGEKRLESLLKAGFTSVRDLGNQGGVDRKTLKVDGARLFSSGPGFTPADGQLPKDSAPDLLKKEYQLLTSPFPKDFPYDVVKLYADEDPNPTISDPALLRKWIDWAHHKNLKVAGHAILSGGIDAAIEAGVDSLEHGTQMNLAQMKRLKEKGIIFVPTFADLVFLLPQGKKHQWSWTPQVTKITCGNIRAAHALNIPVAFGSDNYFSLENEGLDFGASTREILLAYLKCGMNVNEILRSATYRAAQTMGKEQVLGILREKAYADFLVLKENPVEHPETLRSPLVIVKDGKKKF